MTFSNDTERGTSPYKDQGTAKQILTYLLEFHHDEVPFSMKFSNSWIWI